MCISGDIGEEIRRQLPAHQPVTFANRLINALPLRCPQFLRKFLLKWKIERANADVVIVWDSGTGAGGQTQARQAGLLRSRLLPALPQE